MMSRDRAQSEEARFEAESAYRRRQRAVSVSRRHWGWRLRYVGREAAKAVVIILPLGFGLLLLTRYVLDSPRFALAGSDAVVLSGNEHISPSEVASALGAGSQPSIFRISLEEARKQVESIPWARSASLRRIYPNQLLVAVTERIPVAYVKGGTGLELVDAEGVLLEKPAEGSFDFPLLAGINRAMSAADRRARLALFLRFAQELKAQDNGAGWLVSEVDLSDEGDLKALLVQGQDTILVHFGNEDFGERFRTFLALLPEVKRTTPAIDSVDLRYRGQVVVNPKDVKAALP
jgi:cell division protein FtsQ